MNILKLFLWPILLVCLIWMAAIFLGPKIIISAISYVSDGAINLTNVKVSPKLQVSAKVINFKIPSVFDRKDLSGSLRGLSIDWKVNNGFELYGQIGPSVLNRYASLSSARFTLEPMSIFNWTEVDVRLDFEELDGDQFLLDRGSFSGNFGDFFQELNDTKFEASLFRGTIGQTLVEATNLAVAVEHYELNQTLIQQKPQITYAVDEFKIPQIGFKSLSLGGGIGLVNGGVNFDTVATENELKEPQIKAKTLNLLFKQSPSKNVFDGEWKFSLLDVEFLNPFAKIDIYNGDFTLTSSAFDHSGRVEIEEMQLKTDQYFLGQVENANLDVQLSGRLLPSKIELSGNGLLTLESKKDFNATGSFDALISNFDLMGCWNKKCNIKKLDVNYGVSVSSASLVGTFECNNVDCLSRPTRHVLKTDNTNKFFQGLSNLNILNPLSLPVAYMVISGGKNVGSGHELNF